MRTRPPRPIDQGDQDNLLVALQRWPERHGFVGYRTRAFALLLWDGALRTGAALSLNAEEVVADPHGALIHVLDRAVLRPRDAIGRLGRTFLMSERVREAIADYLEVARDAGFLAEPRRLSGPLWIARHPHGAQQRTSRRTAMHGWKTFLASVSGLCQRDYQLDDLVLTGRVAFAQAAKGSAGLLSTHAGISVAAAGLYNSHLQPSGSARDVIVQLDEDRRAQERSQRACPWSVKAPQERKP